MYNYYINKFKLFVFFLNYNMKHYTKKSYVTKTKTKTKKTFLYNPKNPKKSLDLFTNENPNDTIHIKYTTLEDVKNTIDKLEKLYKDKNIHISVYFK